MNRIYKVIWSKVKHQYVVVSELAHSCTKGAAISAGRHTAAVLTVLALTAGVGIVPAWAADVHSEYDENGNLIVYGETAPELNEDTSLYTASTKNTILIGDGLTFSTDRGSLSNSVVLGNNTTIKTNGNLDQNVIIGNGNTLGSNTVMSENVLIGFNSTAKSSESVTVGTKVTNGSGVAIGYNVTGSNDSIIIGKNANSAIGSIAIGNDITMDTNVNNGVAIGNNAHLLTGARGSVAIGYKSNVEDTMSIAMGQGSDVKDEASTAIGSYTKIGDGSVSSLAIGGSQFNWQTQSTTTGASVGEHSSYSSALGVSTKIGDNSEWSTAVGAGATIGNDTDQAAAFGNNAEVQNNADYSLAAGYSASIGQGSTHSTAVGSWAKVGDSAQLASAFGYNTQIGNNATYSVAMGTQATIGVDDEHSLVLGTLASAGNSNDNSIVAGYKAKAGDNVVDSTVIGANSSLGLNVKNSVAVGNNSSVNANVEEASVYGYMANANQNYSTALGGFAKATGQFGSATGYNASAAENAVAEGAGSQALADNSTAVGSNSIIDATSEGGATLGNNTVIGANSEGAIAIGGDADTTDEETAAAAVGENADNAIAMGTNAAVKDSGHDSIAIGNGATINDSSTAAIAIGLNASTVEGSNNTIAIGQEASAGGVGGIAIGQGAHTTKPGTGAVAIGINSETTDNSVVMGQLAKATSGQTVVLGPWAESHSSYGAAIGRDAYVGSNSYGIALGGFATVGENAMKSIAIGASGGGDDEGKTEVKEGASYSIAMGGKTTVGENAEQSVAIGGYQAIVGDNAKYSTAIGTFSDIAANVEHGTAVGYNTNVDANYGTALGNGASANGEWSTALGASTDANHQATAVGSNAQALAGNSVAVGVNSSVAEGADYSVALGTSSKVEEGDAFTTTDLEDFKKKLGDTYNAAWNITSADGTLGVVSVGAKGKERRLVNVARGRIDADSTDAVNGSQLYGLASDLNEKIENAGGDWVLTTNGGTSPGEQTTIGKGNTVDFTGAKDAETEHQNIQVSQAQVKDGKGNVIGTDVSLDLNDRVELGTGADQVVIDATTGKGSIAVGDKVLMSATGAANFGNIELNSEGQGNPQHVSTITGLTNTEWNQTGTYNAGRAATEEQLQDAIGEVNKNAYKGWNLKVGDVSTPVNSNDTVLFQTDTNDKGASNLYITKDGLNVTVGMEDNITLTGVTADRVSVGTVSINAATGIDAGGHKITNVHDGEISASSQEAVNGSQLYQIKEQHTTVSDGKNIHVDETTGDKGQKDYKVSLDDDVYLGEAGTGIALEGTKGMATIGDAISLNGTNGQASFGAVKINGETGNTITGLTNTTWDQNGVYTDGRAATEEQLQDAIGEVNENAYKGWNVTANGNVEGSKTISSGNTVDFAGQTDENGHSNVVVSKEDTKDGTNLKFDLNDKVVLGDDKDSQIVLDGTTGNVSIGNVSVDNGTGISFMADGSATFGKIQINKENGSTIIGLTNTEWDPNAPEGTYSAGRAATEEQLQAAMNNIENTDYDGWKVSANGVENAVDVTTGSTVDFSSTNNADGEKNIQISQDGTNLTFDLNDNIVLGEGEHKISLNGAPEGDEAAFSIGDKFAVGQDGSVHAETQGVNPRITNSFDFDSEGATFTSVNENVSSTTNINGGRIDVRANADNGQANATTINGGRITVFGTGYEDRTEIFGQTIIAGNVKVNSEDGQNTIIGLTNTEWDPNAPEGTYSAGRAATEEQLKAVSDKVGEVSVEAGKHSTVTGDEENITVIPEEQADGHLNYEVTLHDNLYLGGENDTFVQVFGTAGAIKLGSGDTIISIDGAAGHISGLTNLSWDPKNQEQYAGSSLAATESQLHDAFGYLDEKINNISITGDDNINVKPGTGEGSSETPGTGGSDSPSFDIGISDNPQFGGHPADDQGHSPNGSVTVVGKGTDGTEHKVVIDGATGTMSGLSNTNWDWKKYDEGGYEGSSNAATESQLHGAMEGTAQYDRKEDGSIDKGNLTLGGENGTQIHNVAAGKADTDAVNVSQLKGVEQRVENNSMAITNIGNKVGELDSRIDEVGAGAAALAALHPLDFDPDDKWDFSAGYGNYRGENAVAIGAFYRPNEDTMFSVGGTVGNGDNMVNAGVSFKIGQGNNVSTSRVAMAKEIKSMRDIVAKQDAQIQKLTAMVNALVGMEAIAPDTTTMFPDVPENHWAYEAVETMAKTGLVKGYPDGEFKGDRNMTRYEFAQIVYNAIQAGIKVDERLVQEFRPELEYFRIDTISKDKDGNPVIQRVRANDVPVQQ